MDGRRNEGGIILKEEYVKSVWRVMSIKLETEDMMMNDATACAPQVGCEIDERRILE